MLRPTLMHESALVDLAAVRRWRLRGRAELLDPAARLVKQTVVPTTIVHLRIRDDVLSAKVYAGKHAHVYDLLKHDDTYAWQVYEPTTGELLNLSPVQLLNLIASTESTPTAFVTPQEVEDASMRVCVCHGLGGHARHRLERDRGSRPG